MSDIKFSHNYSVYEPKEEAAYPIPASEWTRLKERIKRICPQRRIYQVISSIFFGVFASSVFALFSLYSSTSTLAAWVYPTVWAFFTVSLILGISLAVIDSQQKNIISESTGSVIDDMEALEDRYDTES